MKIKYFADTDTLYIEFREGTVAETRDMDENTVWMLMPWATFVQSRLSMPPIAPAFPNSRTSRFPPKFRCSGATAEERMNHLVLCRQPPDMPIRRPATASFAPLLPGH